MLLLFSDDECSVLSLRLIISSYFLWNVCELTWNFNGKIRNDSLLMLLLLLLFNLITVRHLNTYIWPLQCAHMTAPSIFSLFSHTNILLRCQCTVTVILQIHENKRSTSIFHSHSLSIHQTNTNILLFFPLFTAHSIRKYEYTMCLQWTKKAQEGKKWEREERKWERMNANQLEKIKNHTKWNGFEHIDWNK